MPTEKINEYLAALAKIPGAEDVSKKLGAELKTYADDFETSKGAVAKLTKDRDHHKEQAARFKADADAAASKDEAVKKLAAERDDWRTKAEGAETKYKRRDLELAIGDELGIADKAARADAVDSFMRRMPEGVHINEAGKLVGAAKAIEQFKAERTHFFVPAKGGGGEGGPRLGGDPPPLGKSGAGSTGTDDKRSEWAKRLESTGAIQKTPAAQGAPAK